jgi:hypothetical protein
MTATGMAMRDVKCGEAKAVMCDDFESLSQTPLLWLR